VRVKDVEREILLAFWKVQILHHAESAPVVGQWAIRELRRHGHEVSPGTLYPLLGRMERRGWLKSHRDPKAGSRSRREYSLTRKGRQVLALLRRDVEELHREVVRRHEPGPEPPRRARRA
jgi:DNA-binding PadR family transcriptional regulator